jgi:hypothetical protein
MVGVHRAHGYRIVIYTLDHEPPHVHVTGPGQAKINLLDPGGGGSWFQALGSNDQTREVSLPKLSRDETNSCELESASMAEFTDAQLKRAEARGREMSRTEPRVVKAFYDAEAGRIVLDLDNGCAYAFPAERVRELQGAEADRLAEVEVEVEVDGAGFNLHWSRLDVVLYVPALVSGIFGTRAFMAGELARIAGRTKSPTKAARRARMGSRAGGRGSQRRFERRRLDLPRRCRRAWAV